jgi:omega-amidase
VNRTGVDGKGLDYIKSTQAVNPNGDIVVANYSDEQLDIVDIYTDFVAEYRKLFSTTQDRKPALYKSLL